MSEDKTGSFVKEKIIPAIILGALAWNFNSITGTKHDIDILKTNQAQVLNEQRDLWTKYNIVLENEKEGLEMFFESKLETNEKIHQIENRQKDFEIEYWKNEANGKE